MAAHPDRFVSRALILAVALANAAFLPASFAQAPAPPLKLEPFVERFDPEVKVSMRLVAGAMALHAVEPAGVLKPELRMPDVLPAGLPGGVCLQMRSRDGHYFAEGALTIGALAQRASPIPIDLNTSHAAALRALGPRELATVVTAGSCAQGSAAKPHVFVVDTGAPSGARSNDVRLYLNSERMTTSVVYTNTSGSRVTAACTPIDDGVRKSFDAYCDLSAPAISATEVVIERRRYERKQPPLPFVLVNGKGRSAP